MHFITQSLEMGTHGIWWSPVSTPAGHVEVLRSNEQTSWRGQLYTLFARSKQTFSGTQSRGSMACKDICFIIIIYNCKDTTVIIFTSGHVHIDIACLHV